MQPSYLNDPTNFSFLAKAGGQSLYQRFTLLVTGRMAAWVGVGMLVDVTEGSRHLCRRCASISGEISLNRTSGVPILWPPGMRLPSCAAFARKASVSCTALAGTFSWLTICKEMKRSESGLETSQSITPFALAQTHTQPRSKQPRRRSIARQISAGQGRDIRNWEAFRVDCTLISASDCGWEGGDLGRDAGHVGLDERREHQDHSDSHIDDCATNVDLLLRPLSQLPGLVILQSRLPP